MTTTTAPVVDLQPKKPKPGKKSKSSRTQGIRERYDKDGNLTLLIAYVKVGSGKRALQRSKAFAPGTPTWDIQKWRTDTYKELKEQKPITGTLGAAIEKFLVGLPDGRQKDDFTYSLTPLKKALGHKQIGSISVTDLTALFSMWQAEGLAGSTLNHRRQSLLTLWGPKRPKKRNAIPGLGLSTKCPAAEIAKFAENKPRKGFFEHDKFTALQSHLPSDYRDVVEFAYYSGWRRQEIQRLVWSEVDLTGGVIRLPGERSKNDSGRVLPLVGPLQAVIERRQLVRVEGGITHKIRKQLVTRDYVFHYPYGGKRTAVQHRPIGDWRKEWVKACKKAGCAGAILHDFRRTVVRNLTRAGVAQKVAMELTGHKTDSVFRRYDIVSEADLKQASERLAAHLNGQQK